VIGFGGTMPWHVPGDLKTFRRLTMGRPIVMGRKTFQSIGRALDGRTNIVVTRDADFRADGIMMAASLPQALEIAQDAPSTDNRTMVIGGGEIYRSALPLADTIYMTQIEAEPEGDTWFPSLDPAAWAETSRSPIEGDPRDEHLATLIIYDRIV
jgi:dihydrofolate reductase